MYDPYSVRSNIDDPYYHVLDPLEPPIIINTIYIYSQPQKFALKFLFLDMILILQAAIDNLCSKKIFSWILQLS